MNTTKNKLLAIFCMAIIGFNAIGITYTLGMQRAFAASVDDTYTVTNVIYFNATGIGKSVPETHCLRITQYAKSVNSEWNFKQDPLVKDEPSTGTTPFDPNVTIDTQRPMDIWERQNPSDNIVMFGGYALNMTGAQYVIAEQFNNEIVPINTSDFLAYGFTMENMAFMAAEKMLIFDSPLNYVTAYCEDQGFGVPTIINSTYEKEYNMNTLNFYRSELIKNDMFYYVNATEEPMARSPDFARYGSDLVKAEPISGMVILAIIIVMTFLLATVVIVTILNNKALRDGLNDAIDANANALGDAINVTKTIADSLIGNKAAERAMVLEMYSNGTISWSQLQYLLKQIDGSYNPLINNCTANIAAMTAAYFNATVNLYGEFAAGIADASSWTSWIMPLLYLIAACIIAYIVYVIFSKIKGTQGPTTTVVLAKAL